MCSRRQLASANFDEAALSRYVSRSRTSPDVPPSFSQAAESVTTATFSDRGGEARVQASDGGMGEAVEAGVAAAGDGGRPGGLGGR